MCRWGISRAAVSIGVQVVKGSVQLLVGRLHQHRRAAAQHARGAAAQQAGGAAAQQAGRVSAQEAVAAASHRACGAAVHEAGSPQQGKGGLRQGGLEMEVGVGAGKRGRGT